MSRDQGSGVRGQHRRPRRGRPYSRAVSARSRGHQFRRGFTLLEVILSMAIAILVLAGVSMAINFHLRVVDSGRGEVEQAQLARAILRRVADDLRSTIRYQPVDVDAMLPNLSSVSAVSAAVQEAGGQGSRGGTGGGSSSNSGGGSSSGGSSRGGSSGSSSGGGSSGSGGSSSGVQKISAPNTSLSSNTAASSASSAADSASAAASSSLASENLSASSLPTSEPGLYGNQYQLQVDVSRLPRLDQYQQLMTADASGTPGDLPSDVKTVAYYVTTASMPSPSGTPAVAAAGLMRRELDRAVSSFAMEQGNTSQLDMHQKPVASEVLSIEFAYFSGTEWLTEWDSSASGGLPMAVDVRLTLAIRPEVQGQTVASLVEGVDYRLYRMLVSLPNGKPTSSEGTATTPTSNTAVKP